jgi:hypothetical protein
LRDSRRERGDQLDEQNEARVTRRASRPARAKARDFKMPAKEQGPP